MTFQMIHVYGEGKKAKRIIPADILGMERLILMAINTKCSKSGQSGDILASYMYMYMYMYVHALHVDRRSAL